MKNCFSSVSFSDTFLMLNMCRWYTCRHTQYPQLSYGALSEQGSDHARWYCSHRRHRRWWHLEKSPLLCSRKARFSGFGLFFCTLFKKQNRTKQNNPFHTMNPDAMYKLLCRFCSYLHGLQWKGLTIKFLRMSSVLSISGGRSLSCTFLGNLMLPIQSVVTQHWSPNLSVPCLPAHCGSLLVWQNLQVLPLPIRKVVVPNTHQFCHLFFFNNQVITEAAIDFPSQSHIC